MKPIVNAILASVKHVLGTYVVTINFTPEQKEELANGLRKIADEIHDLTVDVAEASAKGATEGIKEEE